MKSVLKRAGAYLPFGLAWLPRLTTIPSNGASSTTARFCIRFWRWIAIRCIVRVEIRKCCAQKAILEMCCWSAMQQPEMPTAIHTASWLHLVASGYSRAAIIRCTKSSSQYVCLHHYSSRPMLHFGGRLLSYFPNPFHVQQSFIWTVLQGFELPPLAQLSISAVIFFLLVDALSCWV